ncbi:hypothetical protein QJQ45_011535 [Haematococcus lacustris]|nr:hypothetical protein QJQ45_011535 [Haematococcus lacustris]
MGKRLSKAHSAQLNALNNSLRAGNRHCPKNIKAAASRAQATNRDLQAEVQRLRMDTVDGLQGDLDDLQAAHQCLQDGAADGAACGVAAAADGAAVAAAGAAAGAAAAADEAAAAADGAAAGAGAEGGAGASTSRKRQARHVSGVREHRGQGDHSYGEEEKKDENDEKAAWHVVYRKKKSNVNGPAIWAAFHAGQGRHTGAGATLCWLLVVVFAKQEPDGDACAWFSGNMTRLTTVSKKKCKSPRQHTEEQLHLHPPPKEKEQASFEFLTSDRVEQLTAPSQYSATVEQIYDGLLQKFVPPREAHDAMVRAVWSPSACVCERRTSRHPLLDTRIPLCDRAASFHDNNFCRYMWHVAQMNANDNAQDRQLQQVRLQPSCPSLGPPFEPHQKYLLGLTTHQALPPGTVLVQRLIKQCDSVVSHLKEVSGGALVVARMELYFKVDTSSR